MQADLYQKLEPALQAAKNSVHEITQIKEAPLAVLGSPPTPGVFAFDKYSSITLLLDALGQDVGDAGTDLRKRRLMVLPRAPVRRLVRKDDAVVALELAIEGRALPLKLKPKCAIVLANGTIEATRLALTDLGVGDRTSGQPRVGNLMAHMRSNIFVRVKRDALKLGPLSKTKSEVAALMVRGEALNRRFHLQTVAAARSGWPESVIWSMVPDIDLLDKLIADQDPVWISIVFRGIGEMEDDRRMVDGAAKTWRNWIELKPNPGKDGLRKANVMLNPSSNDRALWKIMDRAALDLAEKLAPKGDVQYWNEQIKDWQDDRLNLDAEKKPWRDGIGTTFHEGGTLFMGSPAAETGTRSITDENGKFHTLANVYVASPATFPTLGSANPSLTALSLARHTADAILGLHGIKSPVG